MLPSACVWSWPMPAAWLLRQLQLQPQLVAAAVALAWLQRLVAAMSGLSLVCGDLVVSPWAAMMAPGPRVSLWGRG